MPKRRYTLTRTGPVQLNLCSRGPVTWDRLTIREVGMCVAFTAYDTLGLSREDAALRGLEAETALRGGGVFRLGIFTFSTTLEEK